jgi:hypothetical protein
MKHSLIVSLGFLSIWLLLSNASGVPQAVTKAPGEANHNSCASCHNPSGNYVTSISLDILNADSMLVSQYQPGQTYTVKVKVSATNNPKSFGFQMACLDSLTNTDMGVWSALGDKVKQQTLNVGGKPRKYLVQSSPKASGVFTASWKAPAIDVGKIKFYFAGLAINQNGNTSGDNNQFGQRTLFGPSSSSLSYEPEQTNVLYPNPITNWCNVSNKETRLVIFADMTGRQFSFQCQDGLVQGLDALPLGTYSVEGKGITGNLLWRSKVFK